MSDKLLESIDKKLAIISRLLAQNIAKGRPLNEQMELLSNAGMTTTEIALTLNRTPNNVRVQLHLMKKKSKVVKLDE